MRAFFFVLILAVVALIVLVQTGLVGVSQTRPAQLPSVSAQDGKIVARGGTAPAFDVQTGSVGVGSRDAAVPLPKVTIGTQPGSVKLPAIEVRNAHSQPAAPAPLPVTNAQQK